ncbi:DNA repair protein RecO [Rurimicrobium arvi]|uniref:DNA repair protein RecO n=1 Tax=Rurimicrobium arvi TaxID=2049916 RepID=A0ABP8MLD2_9BACT
MLEPTQGIVLRQVKYGDSSLIISVFTERFGLHAYMLKGIRSAKSKTNRAGLLQVCSLLDLIVDHRPGRQLQHIREFSPAYYYQKISEDIVRNAIAVFSAEVLGKLLPEGETMEDLFAFCQEYFTALDQLPLQDLANFPISFLIRCGRFLGYGITGTYSDEQPFLDAAEGAFCNKLPADAVPLMYDEARMLDELSQVELLSESASVKLSSASRAQILEWYIRFLQLHTQHMGDIRSLTVLRELLR